MAARKTRVWLAPEVIQTSGMDCGPAALKSLLDGHGIPVSYGRLREVCQTDLDGTSIDTLEDVGQQLGLEAQQVLIPADHLFRERSSKGCALAVVRHETMGTHFVVIWRRLGQWVQVMDPSVGRRWVPLQELRERLYRHEAEVSVEDWRAWATSEEGVETLRNRFAELNLPMALSTSLLQSAQEDPGWYGLAALEACLRMVAALSAARAVQRGREAAELVQHLFERCLEHRDRGLHAGDEVPARYWSVRQGHEPGEVRVAGAVLVRIGGLRPVLSEGNDPVHDGSAGAGLSKPSTHQGQALRAALIEQAPSAMRVAWQIVGEASRAAPLAWIMALGMTTAATAIQVILMRGLLDLSAPLAGADQRLAAAAMLLIFLALVPALEWPLARESLRLGRQLDVRLRVALWRRLPLLHDRYFQSRPISDMADRAHSIHSVRNVPATALALGQALLDLALTLGGLLWLAPAAFHWAVIVALASIVVPLLAVSVLSEYDLRLRTHGAALTGFYLDALLGIVPIRAHRAERAVKREHEAIRVEWSRALRDWTRATTLTEGVLGLLCILGAGALLFAHFGEGRMILGSDLLLVFWTLKLPALGQRIAGLGQSIPAQRNALMRLLEPLTTPVAEPLPEPGPIDIKDERSVAPVGFSISGGRVRAAGHEILRNLDLHVKPGEHIAVVGASGAGKSSLIGVLLGWHHLAEGTLILDGHPLSAWEGQASIEALRPQVAWVDPAVQIWNQSLLDNLTYASERDALGRLDAVLDQARLLELTAKLPNGLQALLGEGGSLLSGGEGQRVRLARALMQSRPRLVLLDEPFRGLDRSLRTQLLVDVRQWWKAATLLCVTHDIGATLKFDRVLVVHDGQIVENGSPSSLMANSSRYGELVRADAELTQHLWARRDWRHLSVDRGQLTEANRVENSKIVEPQASAARGN